MCRVPGADNHVRLGRCLPFASGSDCCATWATLAHALKSVPGNELATLIEKRPLIRFAHTGLKAYAAHPALTGSKSSSATPRCKIS